MTPTILWTAVFTDWVGRGGGAGSVFLGALGWKDCVLERTNEKSHGQIGDMRGRLLWLSCSQQPPVPVVEGALFGVSVWGRGKAVSRSGSGLTKSKAGSRQEIL